MKRWNIVLSVMKKSSCFRASSDLYFSKISNISFQWRGPVGWPCWQFHHVTTHTGCICWYSDDVYYRDNYVWLSSAKTLYSWRKICVMFRKSSSVATWKHWLICGILQSGTWYELAWKRGCEKMYFSSSPEFRIYKISSS